MQARIIGLWALWLATGLWGQDIRHEFVQLRSQDGGRPQALYQRPEGPPPKAAFVLMHPRHETFLHFALEPLAKNGCGALGMSPRQGDRSGIHEEALLDVAA